MKLLLQNVTLVNPKGRSSRLGETYDILIVDGQIARISNRIKVEADQKLNLKGFCASPGLVDGHVHFRDPGQTHKEAIGTGAAAAKRGGFTSVLMMANTTPPVDNQEILNDLLRRGRKTGIHVYPSATITKGMKGEELSELLAPGAYGMLCFTDDGMPIVNKDLLRHAMIIAKRLGIPLSLHEEDPKFIDGAGFNRGAASEYFEIGGADRMAEITMVERDLRLFLETGAVGVFQHISAAESVELIRQAKKQPGGKRIHAEATPHHFTLTEEDAIQLGTMAKMNPPLRTEKDRLAIIEGLRDGTLDMIATDHAPHTDAEKARGILEAPSGVIGLETSLALAITVLHRENGFSLSKIIKMMSARQAQVYGLNAGVLREGKPADIVIYDPDEEWTVTGDFASKSRNSPFIGRRLFGKVKFTICGGEIVYEA